MGNVSRKRSRKASIAPRVKGNSLAGRTPTASNLSIDRWVSVGPFSGQLSRILIASGNWLRVKARALLLAWRYQGEGIEQPYSMRVF